MFMLECPFCHGELEFFDDIVMELPGMAGSVYTYQWLKCKKCMRTIDFLLENYKAGVTDPDETLRKVHYLR